MRTLKTFTLLSLKNFSRKNILSNIVIYINRPTNNEAKSIIIPLAGVLLPPWFTSRGVEIGSLVDVAS